MNPFFVEQMAMYSAYHRDRRNRATHFIGIPAIILAIFIPLHWLPLFTVGDNTVTLAVALWLATGAFYLWLDRTVGGLMVLVAFALMLIAKQIAAQGGMIGWGAFAVLFVGGWIFQLVGHVFEGRRPALADNLLQALIGPCFLVAETVFALGLKPELHQAVEARWKQYSVGAMRERAA
ncbi:MAG TPA: Mpo1-like protein [Ferrovibrio sp.]|uniref:Mpo1 family 2-hydroxy fatty acid dioxygenase n=1 Tax=Ferrovibrio sp. TaxID=1917215 RepID=UPI002ED098CB